MANILARITCLCGKNEQTLPLKSSVPKEGIACYCNICRYSTGVLYVSCVPLASPPTTTTHLSIYPSSTKISRLFCSTCGSHMFIHHEDDTWKACMGVVDEIIGATAKVSETGLEKPVQHEFVADTTDGGISICLPKYDGQAIPFFAQGPDQPPVKYVPGTRWDAAGGNWLSGSTPLGLQEPKTSVQGDVDQDANLPAGCHCGRVRFYVTRPGLQSRDPTSPFPDLLVPYHSSSSENPEDVKWWLRSNDTKYLAGTCACKSCRLASGFPIQAWAFVPKVNIVGIDGNPVKFNEGPMRQYESSSGVYREFCTGCGATVFWHCDERPHLIDVSVGLLRAEEGARAESWLSWWTQRVSFKEDAFDRKLIEQLEAGLSYIAV